MNHKWIEKSLTEVGTATEIMHRNHAQVLKRRKKRTREENDEEKNDDMQRNSDRRRDKKKGEVIFTRFVAMLKS